MVRSKNDTGSRLAVRIAVEHPIGTLPRTPFASSRRSPQGETRSMERKNRESYISCTIPQFPPLVVNAVSQSPECVSCHMTQKANSVTLTSYSSPDRAIPQPSARRAVKLTNPPANGRSILRTFFHNPSTQPAAKPHPFFIICARRAPPPPSEPSEPFEPSEPSEPGPRSGPILPILCITSLGTHRKFRYQRSNTIYTLRE